MSPPCWLLVHEPCTQCRRAMRSSHSLFVSASAIRAIVKTMRQPARMLPPKRPRHLRTATGTAPVRDRQFQDAQPGARGLHLHLDVPAVTGLTHDKPRQALAADGAKRAHVGVANAVQPRHQPARQPAGQHLMPAHRSGFPFAAHPRADHEVMRAGADRRDQHVGEVGTIGAVAVEEQDDAATLAGGRHTGGTGAAIAAFGQRDDARPGRTRDRRGGVAAGAVGDDDLVHHSAWQCGDRAGDRLRLVQCGDDGRDAMQRQRRPVIARSAATQQSPPRVALPPERHWLGLAASLCSSP